MVSFKKFSQSSIILIKFSFYSLLLTHNYFLLSPSLFSDFLMKPSIASLGDSPRSIRVQSRQTIHEDDDSNEGSNEQHVRVVSKPGKIYCNLFPKIFPENPKNIINNYRSSTSKFILKMSAFFHTKLWLTFAPRWTTNTYLLTSMCKLETKEAGELLVYQTADRSQSSVR